MAKRRTKEEIARDKEEKAEARARAAAVKAEAKQRTLETQWSSWANHFNLYTACTKCGEMKFCRHRERESVVCKNCHFGIETSVNGKPGLLRRVPVEA